MPTFVGKANNDYGAVASQSLSYSPTVGNLVLMALTVNGNGSTASVIDDAGTDIFNNQLNTWELLGNVTMSQNGIRTELWCCARVFTAFTKVTATFTEANTNSNMAVLEYSDAAVDGVGTATDSGNSNLFFVGTAGNNSAVMVTVFACQQVQPYAASGVYAPNGQPLTSITQGVERVSQGSTSNYLEVQEQTVISGDELVVEAGTTIVVNGLAAVGVVLTGGITLQTPPGFSPVDETKLIAGDIIHAITVDQISLNGEFGMVRPEFFYTIQVDGDTVPLPVSPIDGYNYEQDELYYLYTPLTTFNPQSNWPSGNGILFYCQWNVDQETGIVTCKEFYHPDGNTPVNGTSDGQLVVLTVGQRARGNLGLTTPPSMSEIPFSDISTDKPLTQTLIQTLARNSKFAAVKSEVIYCGEFVDAQVVPQPISPEDGYVYSYGEVKFMSSWKWTTEQGAFAPPPMATADGGNADGGWSQLNELQASVSAAGLVNCQVFFQNHGAIDPSQPDNGGTPFGRLQVFAFCQRSAHSAGIPYLSSNGSLGSASSIITKIVAPSGTKTGNLSLTLAAAAADTAIITAACIKKTLTGSTAVISTTAFTFSSSASVTIPSGTQLQTDVISGYTFDDAHDYYIIIYSSSSTCAFKYSALSGNVNTNTPLQAQVTGDQTGVTTIPSLTPSVDWQMITGILLFMADGTLADNFVEIPFNNFAPGQPLLASAVKQIAYNVQEGSYAVEYFGPVNHVNGDTVALPTSPIDGYEYSRSELFYIWNWHDTGTTAPRLFGFGASVSAAGVVSTFVWHVSSGSSPTCYGAGGSEPADGSVDVLVIACRTRINPQGGSGGTSTTAGGPSDVASLTIGGAGGFTVNGA